MKTLSAPQPKLCNEAPIALDILSAQVVKQATSLADHHQQPTAAVVVVLVVAKVPCEMVDTLRKHRHLDLWGTGIALVRAVFGDNLNSCFHSA